MAEISELRMPDFDLAGAAAAVCAWHAAVGQQVVEGNRLVEVAAGDVTVDLAALASGTLIEKCVEIDQPLEVGQVLARVRVG